MANSAGAVLAGDLADLLGDAIRRALLSAAPGLYLSPRSRELNPVEHIWQFLRDNWLSNRVFESYEDILDHCCFAWNQLTHQPWKIMSIGLRDWAYQ